MSDYGGIRPIDFTVDIYNIRKVLGSSSLTEGQKMKFIRNNAEGIKSVMRLSLGSSEYNMIMANRPLVRYRPIINAFTKRGDKILLAQAIGVPDDKIQLRIGQEMETMAQNGEFDGLTADQVKSLKTYIYRHGSKKQVQGFLNYELSKSVNIANTLHKTLEYNKGGVADYFTRPVHRMSDKTLFDFMGTIMHHIQTAQAEGKITTDEMLELSEWSLGRLCIIQDNSRFFVHNKTDNKK